MRTATVPPTIKPLKRLAVHATTTCAEQASIYGKCILATYTDVRQDICKAEFQKFGQCIREAVRLEIRHPLIQYSFIFLR
ncbi:hypothetical protein J3R30DRAFT_3367021 [Lentinula aciculospora]|uniref:IMS import disulfide relay-system CHCH-CHCH-like Cx9C domain-containing protein n=1 Tax=Lentinula aciculospora TaxID=153920 RepID=A0A9W9DRT2_9AGAR|nr:hypothetical protein J3R30DRAFT_3367021 [Lentinula aciculospora]